jgi:hypothetical protein
MAACQKLVSRGSGDSPDLGPLRRDVDRLLAGERGVLAWLRSLPTGQRLAMVLFMAVVTAIAALAVLPANPRPGLEVHSPERLAVTLAALFLLTAVATWRLLRPLHQPPPPRWQSALLVAAGLFMPVVLALAPHGASAQEHAVIYAAEEGATFLRNSLLCFTFGAVLGLPVLVVAMLLRRADIDGAAVAALAGVAAGLTGNMALQLHCPNTTPKHLLLGHATLLVALVAAVAGATTLRRRLRLRPARH